MLVDVEAPVGDIRIDGVSGRLLIKAIQACEITHAVLADGSHIETGQGDVIFNACSPPPLHLKGRHAISYKANKEISMSRSSEHQYLTQPTPTSETSKANLPSRSRAEEIQIVRLVYTPHQSDGRSPPTATLVLVSAQETSSCTKLPHKKRFLF